MKIPDPYRLAAQAQCWVVRPTEDAGVEWVMDVASVQEVVLVQLGLAWVVLVSV